MESFSPPTQRRFRCSSAAIRTSSLEKVASYELGYRGQVLPQLFATIDVYFSRKTDMLTPLLPATE